MDIERIHGYRDGFEWREVTAHGHPMAGFRCKCDGKPMNCLHSPAIGDRRVPNAKWMPLGGTEW